MAARDDGSHAHEIAVGLDPAVSPNGRIVAFFRPAGGFNTDLWVVGANGRGVRRVHAMWPAPTPRRRQRWSGLRTRAGWPRRARPSGSTLVIDTAAGKVLDAYDNRGTPGQEGVTFSPDSKQLMFGVGNGTVVARSRACESSRHAPDRRLWRVLAGMGPPRHRHRSGYRGQVFQQPEPAGAVLLRASPTAAARVLLPNDGSVPLAWSSDGDTLLLQSSDAAMIAAVVHLGDSTPQVLRPQYLGHGISHDGRFVLAEQSPSGLGLATTVVRVQLSTGGATVLAHGAMSASWSR